mmetsp:Transcript_2018/g.5126  ORF Transcript_2018/g.5126 Transcript_2018/m.5126 type:complete len:92 (+) Transcript_2018:3549-3824(+)
MPTQQPEEQGKPPPLPRQIKVGPILDAHPPAEGVGGILGESLAVAAPAAAPTRLQHRAGGTGEDHRAGGESSTFGHHKSDSSTYLGQGSEL